MVAVYPESRQKWQTKPVERVRANYQLRIAVKNGQIIKPDTCSICGKEARIVGHHQDYSKPLEVVWLCPSCHGILHYALAKRSYVLLPDRQFKKIIPEPY